MKIITNYEDLNKGDVVAVSYEVEGILFNAVGGD